MEDNKESDPLLAATTYQLVGELITESSEELLGTGHRRHAVTGRRRVLAEDEQTTVAVALYDEPERRHMGQVISDETGANIESPLGHVDFMVHTPSASIEGQLYLTETGVVAKVMCHLDWAHFSPDDAKLCYASAKAFGVGDTWVNGLIEAIGSDGVITPEQPFTLTDPQLYQLNETLTSFT